MKRYTAIAFAIIASALLSVGCKKEGQVETAKLKKSFQAAEPSAQTSVDKAVASIKQGDYANAMANLQMLSAKAKLTPEQEQAVKDVIDQIKKIISEKAEKAAEEGGKAMDDLKKSLPK